MNLPLCDPIVNGFPANLAEQACLNDGHQFNLPGALQTIIAFHGLALTLVKLAAITILFCVTFIVFAPLTTDHLLYLLC
jgi:hypothetical protein